MNGACEVGILFADIAGSTRIYEILGDQRAHSVVRQCLRITSEPVIAHGGIVVKTIGDELMAAFGSPAAAFSASVEIQRRINEMPPLPFGDGTMRVALRIGFHFGTAVREKDDYFGDSVNVAARVVALAKANQILTTGDVMDLLPTEHLTTIAEFGRIDVKGRHEPVRVARVEWEPKKQSTTEAPQKDSVLRLVFEGRNWRVPQETKSISCGRDQVSDLVLKGAQVSRAHATIERRRGKVFLIDHSTNGTYLVLENQPPLKLHREEFGLIQHGHIVFGSIDSEDADNLWYYIE